MRSSREGVVAALEERAPADTADAIPGSLWPISLAIPNQVRFHDGLLSRSRGAQAWASRLKRSCPAVGQEAVLAYSYKAPGVHYLQLDTRTSLAEHLRQFRAYVNDIHTRLIPIGFSLGSNVVLLGAAEAIRQGINIPAVVLIAPAHGPKQELVDEYEEYFGDRTDDIPRVVYELGPVKSTWRARITTAYRVLVDSGIQIHVVHSEKDSFASYDPRALMLDRTRFEPEAINPHIKVDESRSAGWQSVDYHIRFRDAPETFQKVCEILRKYELDPGRN